MNADILFTLSQYTNRAGYCRLCHIFRGYSYINSMSREIIDDEFRIIGDGEYGAIKYNDSCIIKVYKCDRETIKRARVYNYDVNNIPYSIITRYNYTIGDHGWNLCDDTYYIQHYKCVISHLRAERCEPGKLIYIDSDTDLWIANKNKYYFRHNNKEKNRYLFAYFHFADNDLTKQPLSQIIVRKNKILKYHLHCPL